MNETVHKRNMKTKTYLANQLVSTSTWLSEFQELVSANKGTNRLERATDKPALMTIHYD